MVPIAAYRVEAWWFEILVTRQVWPIEYLTHSFTSVQVMIQKLMITSVLVFVYPGTATQVALGFFIAFSFLLVSITSSV